MAKVKTKIWIVLKDDNGDGSFDDAEVYYDISDSVDTELKKSKSYKIDPFDSTKTADVLLAEAVTKINNDENIT